MATTIYGLTGIDAFHNAYKNGQKSKNCERFRIYGAIRNRWSGKVLEYDSYRMKAKTKDGRLDQLWFISDNSGGYYNIRSVKYPQVYCKGLLTNDMFISSKKMCFDVSAYFCCKLLSALLF